MNVLVLCGKKETQNVKNLVQNSQKHSIMETNNVNNVITNVKNVKIPLTIVLYVKEDSKEKIDSQIALVKRDILTMVLNTVKHVILNVRLVLMTELVIHV